MRVIHLNNLYYQYQKNLLDESFWDDQIEFLKTDIRNPINLALYLESPIGLEQIISDLLLELENH